MEIKTIRSYYVGVRLRIRSHVFAYVLVTIRTSVRHCTATNTNVCESTLVYGNLQYCGKNYTEMYFN